MVENLFVFLGELLDVLFSLLIFLKKFFVVIFEIYVDVPVIGALILNFIGRNLVEIEERVKLLVVGFVLQFFADDIIALDLFFGEFLQLLLSESGRNLIDSLLVIVRVNLFFSDLAVSQRDLQFLVVVLLERVHEFTRNGAPDLHFLVVRGRQHQILLTLKINTV